MCTEPDLMSTAVAKVIAAMRRVVEGQMRADLARRWDGEGMSVGQIAQLLDVSRGTVHRYLGPRRKGSRAPAAAGGKQTPEPCFLQPEVVSRSCLPSTPDTDSLV